MDLHRKMTATAARPLDTTLNSHYMIRAPIAEDGDQNCKF